MIYFVFSFDLALVVEDDKFSLRQLSHEQQATIWNMTDSDTTVSDFDELALKSDSLRMMLETDPDFLPKAKLEKLSRLEEREGSKIFYLRKKDRHELLLFPPENLFEDDEEFYHGLYRKEHSEFFGFLAARQADYQTIILTESNHNKANIVSLLGRLFRNQDYFDTIGYIRASDWQGSSKIKKIVLYLSEKLGVLTSGSHDVGDQKVWLIDYDEKIIEEARSLGMKAINSKSKEYSGFLKRQQLPGANLPWYVRKY